MVLSHRFFLVKVSSLAFWIEKYIRKGKSELIPTQTNSSSNSHKNILIAICVKSLKTQKYYDIWATNEGKLDRDNLQLCLEKYFYCMTLMKNQINVLPFKFWRKWNVLIQNRNFTFHQNWNFEFMMKNAITMIL